MMHHDDNEDAEECDTGMNNLKGLVLAAHPWSPDSYRGVGTFDSLLSASGG